MARTQLTCSCGWVFFVANPTSNVVACPSCGDEVKIPHAKAGKPMNAAEIARDKAKQRSLIMLAGGALLGCGILVAVVLALGSSGKPKTDGGGGTKYGGGTATPYGNPTTSRPPPPRTVPPIADPEVPGAKIDWERRMNFAIYKLNVAGMTTEVLRWRKANAEAEQLEGNMMNYWQELTNAIKMLRQELGQGGVVVPGHMLPGDRITYFESQPFEQMSFKEKDQILSAWLSTKLRGGVMLQVSVKRQDAVIPVIMNFIECPKDLRYITKLISIDLVESPDPVAPGRPVMVAIPADIARDTRERLLALHPYWQLHLGEDKAKIEGMLKDGKAEASEIEWLKNRIVEINTIMSDEMSSCRAQIAELETRLKGTVDANDVIILKNGERREGKIIKDTELEIELLVQHGTGPTAIRGSRKIKKEDIDKVLKGAGASTEFDGKFRAAREDARALYHLMTWCKEKNLKVQMELVAYALILKDPGNETARKELGFLKTADGVWTREREGSREGDKFKYDGRLFTLQEFLAYLRQKGYIEVNGLWCEKRDWSFRIDSLYADEKKVQANGGMIIQRIVKESRAILDPNTKQYRTEIVSVETGRFLSGGSLVVTAPTGSTFLEARVRAVSELTLTGNITVRVLTEDQREMHLYTMISAGRNDQSYDVTAAVKGTTRFFVEAQLAGAQSPIDNGTAMFLPSTRNTRNVFEAKAKISVPLTKINELLSRQPQPGPGPGPGPVPLPGPADGSEEARKQLEAAAESVLGPDDHFKDAVLKIRARTDGMKFSGSCSVPEDYKRVIKVMPDPTTWDPNLTPAAAMLDLGGWWSQLNLDARKQFARFFGVYCAWVRHWKSQK